MENFFFSVAGCGSGSNSETTLPSSLVAIIAVVIIVVVGRCVVGVGAWLGAGPDQTVVIRDKLGDFYHVFLFEFLVDLSAADLCTNFRVFGCHELENP